MNPVALAVDDLREQYTREMALVRQTCERTGDGTAAIRRRSAVVDRLLIEMWRRAFAGQPSLNIALLALGSTLLLFLKRRTTAPLTRSGLILLILATASLSTTGCSGKLPDQNTPYTAPGSYTYTVSATDGILTHSATYTLNVTKK